MRRGCLDGLMADGWGMAEEGVRSVFKVGAKPGLEAVQGGSHHKLLK